MWILDNIRGFLKIWTRESAKELKPTQPSVDVDAIDFTKRDFSQFSNIPQFNIDLWFGVTKQEEEEEEKEKKAPLVTKKEMSLLWELSLAINPATSFIWWANKVIDKYNESKDLVEKWEADNVWEAFYWTTLEPWVKRLKDKVDYIKQIREQKNLKEDVLLESLWWDAKLYITYWWPIWMWDRNAISVDWKGRALKIDWNQVNSKYFIETYNNILDNFVNTEAPTLEWFKTSLKDNWFDDWFINNITKDSLEKAISIKYKWESKLEDNFWKLWVNQVHSEMTKLFKDEFGKINRFNESDVKNVSIYLDSFDIENWDINEFKKSLTNLWVKDEIVSSISQENIFNMKEKLDLWKDESGIIEIKDDWWYTQKQWWYNITFDWAWNLVEKEYVWWSLLSKSDLELTEMAWVVLYDNNTYIKNMFDLVANIYKWEWHTAEQLTTVAVDAAKALIDEIGDQKNHLKWTMELIKKARREWENDLADMLEGRLKESAVLFNLFQKNLYELTTIKLENKLVWRDLKKFIEKEYWMDITQFMKRDDKWNVIDTWWWTMADYIINQQVDSNAKYYVQSKNVSVLSKIYHSIVWWVDTALAPLKKPFVRLQNWTIRAQIHRIWWFDPIPWFQTWELWRRSYNQVAWISDEFLAFIAPEIIKAVSTWWASMVSAWLRIPWYINKTSKIAYWLWKTADFIQDWNKAIRWVHSVYKWDKINSFWLWISYALNASMWALRDLNIEVQANRVDPERWDEFNTNLAIATMIVPRFFDWIRAAKSLGMVDWISNFDVIRHMADWETSRWALNSVRKQAAKNLSDISKEYEWLSAKWRKDLKAMFGSSLIQQDAFMKRMAIEKSITKADKMPNSPLELALTDIELFAQKVWSWLKGMDSPEMLEKLALLKQTILDPAANLADVIKVVHDLPWEVRLWKLRSTLKDSPEATKKFSEYIRIAARRWELFNVQYIWDIPELASSVRYVFNDKFLPTKVFSATELNTAFKKANDLKWLPIRDVVDPKNRWIFWDDLWWGKYRLSSDWKQQLWIREQPSKSWIVDSLNNWKMSELEKNVRAYLWKEYDNLVLDWEIIDDVSKILSNIIC